MASRKGNIVSAVEQLALPIARRMELELWNIEFVKEGGTYYLRIFIDKKGGVSIDDCEAMSRAIDVELERADPIEQSYCLEVSSPGIERLLTRDWHFERYIGEKIRSRLIRPDAEGRREIEGTLKSYDGRYAQIETDTGTVLVNRSEAAYFKTVDIFDSDRLMEE